MAAVQIKTDISLDEYEFVDTDGKVLFSVAFNPADINIIRRYEKVVEEIEKIDLSSFGEETAVALENAEKELGAQLDLLLNADVSKKIFAVMSPFTPLANGKLYAEEIIEKIGSVIEAETGKRLKKVQNRIGKYTAKYRK